jgi:hypothetical protein
MRPKTTIFLFVSMAAAIALLSLTSCGLTFVGDPGEWLTYSGTGYETNGIGSGRVILLPDGRFRIYYGGAGDHGRLLSAASTDGLNFTREDDVRLDVLCPPEGGAPGITPIIDALGTFHTFSRAVLCTGNYVNSKAGLFDGTTTDGLTINISSSPFVAGYSKGGMLTNQVEPRISPSSRRPRASGFISFSITRARSFPRRPSTVSSTRRSSRPRGGRDQATPWGTVSLRGLASG